MLVIVFVDISAYTACFAFGLFALFIMSRTAMSYNVRDGVALCETGFVC